MSVRALSHLGRGRLRSLSLLALLGLGCVADDPAPGPPYDIVVLDRVEASVDNGQSGFALQHRRLETLTNFSRLESPLFRVRQGGTLTVTTQPQGDQISSGSFDGGGDPDLRYVVENGSAIPRDDATLFMFSVAYQFEHLLPLLVDGSAPEVGTLFRSRGPMDVIFGPNILINTDGIKVAGHLRTNAFFNPDGWQFGILRTSELERVPLGVDPRVIAHEVGHSIFQLTFFGGDEAPCAKGHAEANAADPWFPGRLSNELVISGLNEGVADWMSFTATGGTNPVEIVNIPSSGTALNQNEVRKLTEDNFRWGQIDKVERAPVDLRCSHKYCLGTLFVRSLVATYLAQGHAITDESARHEFSRAVVAALRGTLYQMQTIGLPPATEEIAACQVPSDVSLERDPPVIGSFLEAFLDGFPAELAGRLCMELADRFEDGFPVAFRKRCAS